MSLSWIDNKNSEMPIYMPEDIDMLTKDAKIQIFKFLPKDRDFNTYNKKTLQIYNVPCDGVVFDILFCPKYNRTYGPSNIDIPAGGGDTSLYQVTLSESMRCFVN